MQKRFDILNRGNACSRRERHPSIQSARASLLLLFSFLFIIDPSTQEPSRAEKQQQHSTTRIEIEIEIKSKERRKEARTHCTRLTSGRAGPGRGPIIILLFKNKLIFK